MENRNENNSVGAKAALMRFRRHPLFIHVYATVWTLTATAIIAGLISLAR